MTTVRMSGDLGDCVLGLPVVKHYGKCLFYCEAANYTRQRLTWDKWQPLVPLLKAQPYIIDVLEWTGQSVTVNLNDFRALMFKSLRRGVGFNTSLTDWMLDAHQIDRSAKDKAWLTVEPNKIARVVFARSGPGRSPTHIYHNPDFPWHKVYQRYGKHAVFLGLEEEYHVFKNVCADVPFHRTENLLEAAQVIAGAELFVGNQSLLHAIAEGLKQRILLEVWKAGPNCLSFRPGVYHGWDHNAEMPEI